MAASGGSWKTVTFVPRPGGSSSTLGRGVESVRSTRGLQGDERQARTAEQDRLRAQRIKERYGR